jgi:hypothetical protein
VNSWTVRSSATGQVSQLPAAAHQAGLDGVITTLLVDGLHHLIG